jgi:hypothetical protein
MDEKQQQMVMKKEDFYLLMESYRNNIELSTTLIENLKTITKQNEAICSKQREICDLMQDLVRGSEKRQTSTEKHIDGVKDDVTEQISGNKVEMVKQYGEVKNRLNINTVTAGGLIVTLVGLVITLLHLLGKG